MAEDLGGAVLTLRTDDQAFGAGIDKAETRANRLGTALDKTAASSGKLGQQLTATGRSAAAAGSQFDQAGRQVATSAGAQRAGMQQLSFQIGDVAQQFALGVRPQVIFAQQAGQVIQAVQLMTGGTSRLAGFLGGPWGIAITSAAVVLTPFIGKLFETDRAMEAVEDGADAMGRAQSALGGIFDMVSGKLKTQNELLLINARLMAINLRAEAQSKRAGARETLIDAQRPGAGSLSDPRTWFGAASPSGMGNASAVRDLLRDVGAGRMTREQALARSESMDFSGTRVSRSEFQAALRDTVVANLNDRMADLIDQSLDSGELASELREPGKPDKPGRPKKDTGPTAEEITRRFNDEMDGLRARMASAEGQVAHTVEERAELELKQVDLAERATIRAIEADEHYSRIDKDRLKAAAEMLAETERQAVEFRKQRELEQEAQSLADEKYRAEVTSLQLQYELADTQADRKHIALEIFDAEQAYLRSKLEAVRDSETASAIEKQRAQLALEALQATGAAGRDRVARGNETEVERYLRYLNQTQGQMAEELDRVAIDGLEALEDGLLDAITGVKSLKAAFHDMAQQVLADLMRIVIRQMIVRSLANILLGGSAGGGGAGVASSLGGSLAGAAASGGGGGGLGSLFAGLFASGGLIPAGQFGIVGERGPEPVIGTSKGAMVLPNRTLLGGGLEGGSSMQMTMHNDFRGADPAAVAAIEGRLDRMQRELPGTIVTTMQDARARFVWR